MSRGGAAGAREFMDKLGFPFPRPGLVKGSYAGSVEERLINAKAGFRKWVACVQKKESFAWQDLEVAVWQRDGDVSDVYSSQKKQQRADNKAEKKARTRRKKSLRPVHYTEATRQSRNPAQGLCEYGKVVGDKPLQPPSPATYPTASHPTQLQCPF